MAKSTTLIKTIKLSHLPEGTITVVNINEPYGEFSTAVTSIGVSLKDKEDKEPEWRVHIPIDKIDELVSALHEAKRVYEEGDIGYYPHDELASDTGGGGA
jgi:hypothetical protein